MLLPGFLSTTKHKILHRFGLNVNYVAKMPILKKYML